MTIVFAFSLPDRENRGLKKLLALLRNKQMIFLVVYNEKVFISQTASYIMMIITIARGGNDCFRLCFSSV